MTDITPRKLAEKKLITYQERLRSLASELSLAEERERRRLAADLHDRIGQALAIIKIRLGALRELVSSQSILKELNGVRELVEETICDTRLLTVELSPPILYEVGFVAAVEWLTEHIQEEYAIQIQFEDDKYPKPLNSAVSVLLFKMIRELLFNVVKHAQARKAKVKLKRDNDKIEITVEDNGVGFDIDKTESRIFQTGGFGLFSICERLNYLGGHFKIKSSPGSGTCVIISAPLKDARERRNGERRNGERRGNKNSAS